MQTPSLSYGFVQQEPNSPDGLIERKVGETMHRVLCKMIEGQETRNRGLAQNLSSLKNEFSSMRSLLENSP